MSGICYLDNSSTTKMCPTAIRRMTEAAENCWGNPSSLHGLGVRAQETVSDARKKLAERLLADPSEIFFTASGTEANNTAVFGAAERGKKRGGRVVTTATEHPSVLNCMDELSKRGFEVIKLMPDRFGVVSAENIFAAVNAETVLVSIMLVNNELGGINPVKAAASAIKRAKAPALLHCDAVQAFGKIDVHPAALGVDLLSVSAHKIHGPKGIGALYKRKGLAIPPLVFGGGQESGLRSGTEAVHQTAGFCGALSELDINGSYAAVEKINAHLKKRLTDEEIALINSPDDALPYILNISVPGYRSETLLHFLESRQIYVSSGSACSKGRGSHVLRAAGLAAELVDSALRISFSRDNTIEDADRLADALKEAKQTIIKSSGRNR